MLADGEFEEAVPKALQQTLGVVRESGTENKLERFPKRFAHFAHYLYTIDVGEGANLRRLYGVTHVLISENRDDIKQASDDLRAIIETEL